MKTISFLLFLVLTLSVTGNGQETGKKVTSRISHVTIFRSGAQVNRTTSVSLQAGEHILLFTDLPERLNPQSVQVNGKGKFTILSVQHQVNYLASQEKHPELVELEKKLNGLKDRLFLEEGQLFAYKSEEEMILANKSLGGSQQGVDATRLKETADFFRNRLTELQHRKLEVNNRIRVLKEEIQKVTNQISITGSLRNKPTSELLVNVSVPSPVQAEFQLSYLVSEAGWYPTYDVRATDISQPIQMNYKANVIQTTGEEWKDVKIALSTGNPGLSGSKPVLPPWYLDFFVPERKFTLQESLPGRAPGVAMKKSAVAGYEEAEEIAATPASLTTVTEGQTNVEFNIGIPYTVTSDGKSKAVEIQSFTLPAAYEYQSAPKLDKDAFLLARIAGWEEYNLLPGEISLFFEGTYVGKSFLDVKATADTLNLSMGRDRNILISRTAMRDFTRKQFLGNRKSETRSWEIDVRNNKKSKVRIILQDQIPVSTNKEIEVECNEYSGGRLDRNTGLVRWELELNPGESRKLKLVYSVKYPKDQVVILE